nr:uncharacterized protein LOC119164358 [Rhipicephalus microplus]XP_037272465.1 uncharacterized protein LOC119164385 [Rhipicephalus microplus]
MYHIKRKGDKCVSLSSVSVHHRELPGSEGAADVFAAAASQQLRRGGHSPGPTARPASVVAPLPSGHQECAAVRFSRHVPRRVRQGAQRSAAARLAQQDEGPASCLPGRRRQAVSLENVAWPNSKDAPMALDKLKHLDFVEFFSAWVMSEEERSVF